jgi:hypothetical protein
MKVDSGSKYERNLQSHRQKMKDRTLQRERSLEPQRELSQLESTKKDLQIAPDDVDDNSETSDTQTIVREIDEVETIENQNVDDDQLHRSAETRSADRNLKQEL